MRVRPAAAVVGGACESRVVCDTPVSNISAYASAIESVPGQQTVPAVCGRESEDWAESTVRGRDARGRSKPPLSTIAVCIPGSTLCRVNAEQSVFSGPTTVPTAEVEPRIVPADTGVRSARVRTAMSLVRVSGAAQGWSAGAAEKKVLPDCARRMGGASRREKCVPSEPLLLGSFFSLRERIKARCAAMDVWEPGVDVAIEGTLGCEERRRWSRCSAFSCEPADVGYTYDGSLFHRCVLIQPSCSPWTKGKGSRAGRSGLQPDHLDSGRPG